ncbi:hypothetical protein KUCAC02_032918, partial [Chaenocephalus aceratus]
PGGPGPLLPAVGPPLSPPRVATTLSVSLLTRSSSVNVSALIRHKELILSSNSTIVSGGSTQLLTLPPIPESESSHWSTYQLEVKGHRGGKEVFLQLLSAALQPQRLLHLPPDGQEQLPAGTGGEDQSRLSAA